MKKCRIVAFAAKQQAGESDKDYQTRLIALDLIKYGKDVPVPDDFDPLKIRMRLAEEFITEEPGFRAVEFELQVVDA